MEKKKPFSEEVLTMRTMGGNFVMFNKDRGTRYACDKLNPILSSPERSFSGLISGGKH